MKLHKSDNIYLCFEKTLLWTSKRILKGYTTRRPNKYSILFLEGDNEINLLKKLYEFRVKKNFKGKIFIITFNPDLLNINDCKDAFAGCFIFRFPFSLFEILKVLNKSKPPCKNNLKKAKEYLKNKVLYLEIANYLHSLKTVFTGDIDAIKKKAKEAYKTIDDFSKSLVEDEAKKKLNCFKEFFKKPCNFNDKNFRENFFEKRGKLEEEFRNWNKKEISDEKTKKEKK